MKRALCVAVVILMTCSFSSLTFAGGPKCPCYKDKDLEKLMKKGWTPFWETSEGNKSVGFYNPEIWDHSTKGKGEQEVFIWSDLGGPEATCEVNTYKEKWKSENYRDYQDKRKIRPMLAGGEDSAVCAAILDNFIDSLPPM